MERNNIFDFLPENLDQEAFDLLLQSDHVKIERIVSKGHTSPESGWAVQEQNEWVMVLRGGATLCFESGDEVSLAVGSHVNIPAGTKHRVSWTTPEVETVWLAVHYA
jgi:cupin 2 domain-containing protein